MSKHTPGPWQIEDYRSQGDWRSTGVIWAREPDSYIPGTKICSVNCNGLHSESGKEKIEEFEANARLIAATPELLEACVNAFHYIMNDGDPELLNGWTKEKFLEQLRSAVAKAEGK